MKKRIPLCGLCGNEKHDNGKKLVCRPCNQKRAAKWAKENRERMNERNRTWVLNNKEHALKLKRFAKVKQMYGLSKTQYLDLLNTHNHKCSICGEKETVSLKGTVWNLSIDHCHTTGKIRGLLCAQCNVGLAKFRENIRYFKNAINYLQTRNGESASTQKTA